MSGESFEKDNYDKYTLNWTLMKRLRRVLKILFPSFKSMTFIILASVIAIRVFCEMSGYVAGLIPSLFLKQLIARDREGVVEMMIKSCILVFVRSFGETLSMYAKNCLVIAWRQTLNNQIHRKYFSYDNFYKLNVTVCKLDNPDQRIAQDVDKMCKAFLTLVTRTIMFPGILIFYTYKAYMTTGAYAIIGSYSFMFLSAIINITLTAPIVKATTELEKCEGDYRFKHAGVRLNSETIAFQRSHYFEWRQVSEKLNKLCEVLQKVNNKMCAAKASVVAFDSFQTVAAYVVLSIAFLYGNFENMSDSDFSALIAANHFYMSYINSTFGNLVAQYENISQVAGTLHRIGELLEELDQMSEETSNKERLGLKIAEEKLEDQNTYCKMEDITVYSPNNTNKTILKGFSFQFQLKENVLITGDASCGKTTILRLIRGLWDQKSGNIIRSRMVNLGSSSVYFQPQTILLCSGTLIDQFHFPFNNSTLKDVDDLVLIKKYLEMMGLKSLIKSRGAHLTFRDDWNVMLSPSEKKLISLARILYHKPEVAIIDDTFNNLNVEKIQRFFTEAKRLGITLVTVGNEHLIKYHSKVINTNQYSI